MNNASENINSTTQYLCRHCGETLFNDRMISEINSELFIYNNSDKCIPNIDGQVFCYNCSSLLGIEYNEIIYFKRDKFLKITITN